jgi:hypothetical protein
MVKMSFSRISETFVRALPEEEFPDLGEQALKRVKAKVRVFTLPRYRPA